LERKKKNKKKEKKKKSKRDAMLNSDTRQQERNPST
jgi:hypothetical protein